MARKLEGAFLIVLFALWLWCLGYTIAGVIS